MNDCRGLCVISIPKSGTMFVSRFLERATGTPVVFGLQPRTATQLAAELASGWHPAIRAAADPRCVDMQAMCRRFALMLARHRGAAAAGSTGTSAFDVPGGEPLILSDHGYSSFLQFLINPCPEQILDPDALIRRAREQGLAPVFLYRSLTGVANSLALFLAAGKSFLLSLQSRDIAAQLVVDLYAPVLAAQTRAWLQAAERHQVLALSYEKLVADPQRHLFEVARIGQLAGDPLQFAGEAGSYRPWTYRSRAANASWRDTFTAHQQQSLIAMDMVAGVTQ